MNTTLSLEEFRAHTTAQHGVVIGCRLTSRRAPVVITTHVELDSTLPPGHISVSTGDHRLVVRSMDWDGRGEALDRSLRRSGLPREVSRWQRAR